MKLNFSFIIAFILIFSCSIQAQTNPSLNSAEIVLALKKLNTAGSVLYIAAHPDDENTRLLVYLSKEKNLRTGYLSMTRGDGGQNLVGKEQGESLGLLRTQELLAARRVDGAEQFFTRANDFGYSKNPEETLKTWNKDSVLADVVWTIRKFRPDVIICRFPTTGEGGHGHHTASAILAIEAFDAAADPKRFPNQLEYTKTWQAKRIFLNTFNFGSVNTTSPDQLKIDVGIYNPLLGKSYGELSAESRSMHKSQGFGSAKTRGSSIEYFKLLKGDVVKEDLFEGIDLSWKKFTSDASFQKSLDACMHNFNFSSPEKIIPELISIYEHLQQLKDNSPGAAYWKEQKLKETESLLLACSGLFIEATASDYIGIPGNKTEITSQVICRNNCKATLNRIYWLGQSDTVRTLTLKQNELYSFKQSIPVPKNIPYSNPYWLEEAHDNGNYTVRDQKLIGMPENDPPVKMIFDLTLEGSHLAVERNLVYKSTDPVKGEKYKPFEILPPVTVNLNEKIFMFPDMNGKKIQFRIKANAAEQHGKLVVSVPAGWSFSISDPNFNLVNKGDEVILEGTVQPGKENTSGKLKASLVISDNTISKSISRIEYDHIPSQFILSPSEAGLVNVKLKKGKTTIGYIPGAGDDVAECLMQVGYSVTILTDELLNKEDLSKYNAIITGVRAFNTNDHLASFNKKLMSYVEAGGNMIMQYNTNNRLGPMNTKIGPYPFTISRDRVTDENAEVRFLDPTHPVMTIPNTIDSNDFKGWVQERGIYFASELDKNYVPIFSMNDPGEKPLDGSLVVAKYGKGNFVYTGLDFFRELPAGVPGAYRLFANLVNLPENKAK